MNCLEYVDCSDPVPIVGGNYTYERTNLNASALLKCFLPYVLTGSEIFTCGNNGSWIGTGMCSKLICCVTKVTKTAHIMLLLL